MRDFRNQIARGFSPYLPGEQPQGAGWVKLNTNENPYPPSAKVLQALGQSAEHPDLLRKYPHPFSESLKELIAQHYKIPADFVTIFNGSDEALAVICRCVLDAKDDAAYAAVSYSLYPVLIEQAGGHPQPVPMHNSDGLTLRIDQNALREHTARLKFLTNPNAPTGEFLENDKVVQLLNNTESLWVVDEAYHEFTRKPSMATLVSDYENLIVVRTFSKSHSLAGLRVGYTICGNTFVNAALNAFKDSYNLDSIACRLASAAILDAEYTQSTVEKIIASRDSLLQKLSDLKFSVLPSSANFLLAKPPASISAEDLYLKLKENKILIRYFKNSEVSEFVRITIGTEEENTQLLSAIKKIINGSNG